MTDRPDWNDMTAQPLTDLVDADGQGLDPASHVECPGHVIWLERDWRDLNLDDDNLDDGEPDDGEAGIRTPAEQFLAPAVNEHWLPQVGTHELFAGRCWYRGSS